MAINKLVINSSTTNEMVETVNGLVDYAQNDFSAINELLLSSANGDSTVNYIVSGDSTRKSAFNKMIEYYTSQLSKLFVTVVSDARSGAKGSDWLANTYADCGLQHAIDSTPNTGAGTILEYSFGINDTGTDADKKTTFKAGIEAYMTAKPDAKVLLVSPVGGLTQRLALTNIYKEIASELNLPLIVGAKSTDGIISNSDYMQDATHPNQYGSRRVVNYIMSEMLNDRLRCLMTLIDEPKDSPASTIIPVTVQDGFYNFADGVYRTDLPNWRSLQLIDVEPNFKLLIDHGGNSSLIAFYDAAGTFISTSSGNLNPTIPAGAFKAGITITSDGATWDALSYTVTVQYDLDDSNYLRQTEINSGLPVALPYVANYVDSDGFEPKLNQIISGLSGGKWKWIDPV